MSETLCGESVRVTEELDKVSRGSAVNADLLWLQLSEGFPFEVERSAVNNQ